MSNFQTLDGINILFVDLSYYLHHLINGYISYYKKQKLPEEKTNDAILSFPDFSERIKKNYYDKLAKYIKKHHLQKHKLILVSDDKKNWRKEKLEQYKSQRQQTPHYWNIFSELLEIFKKNHGVLHIPYVEADDIIMNMVIFLQYTEPPGFPRRDIHILTNDNDYLQVMFQNVNIVNLDNKNLQVCSQGSPQLDLFLKIVLGDKSDNIDKVFDKVGIQTAKKLYSDPVQLHNLFKKHPEAVEKYNMNEFLIDVRKIPDKYKRKIIELYEQTFQTRYTPPPQVP